jgi:hypothetical protein
MNFGLVMHSSESEAIYTGRRKELGVGKRVDESQEMVRKRGGFRAERDGIIRTSHNEITNENHILRYN